MRAYVAPPNQAVNADAARKRRAAPVTSTLGVMRKAHMRTLTSLVLFLASSTFVCNADAQGQDGTFFLQACGAAVKQSDGAQLSQEESLGALYCGSYVSGFLDGMSLAVGSTKSQRVVCLPERGITNDQAARLLVKYLRENPQTLHQSGRMSLYIALAKSFPCAK